MSELAEAAAAAAGAFLPWLRLPDALGGAGTAGEGDCAAGEGAAAVGWDGVWGRPDGGALPEGALAAWAFFSRSAYDLGAEGVEDAADDWG